MKNYYDLPSGIVVQRSSISCMVEKDMAATLNALVTAGKTVRVVESASEFFSDNNFFAAVDAGDLESLALIAEQRSIALSIAELTKIGDYVKFKADLKARLDAQRPPYEFAALPAGWTFDSAIRITTKGVYRAGNSDYKLSLATLERMWKVASRRWAKLDALKQIADIRSAGYNRVAVVHDERIEVGCQSIYRYELEQLALSQGWEIPSK